MPSANRQYATPIIVEVKPSNITSRSNKDTFNPSAPPSPKAVRFSGDFDELVTGITRPLTPKEAWSLYNFEVHARTCQTCYDPSQAQLRGGRLCDSGLSLANDVSLHVVYRAGEIYSSHREDDRYVRVEVPHAYLHTRGLLRTQDRSTRRLRRNVPVVEYDNVTFSKSTSKKPEYEVRKSVIVEPARTDDRSSGRTKHRSTRYRAVVVGDDAADTSLRLPRRDEKRGSLYERDMQRPKKDYVVEIREPSDRTEWRRREERRARYWD